MSFPIVDGLRGLELGYPGPTRAFLNNCVLAGDKRATAGRLSEYVEEDETWEYVGEQLVLLDDDLNGLAVLEVTRVEQTTFSEVTWEFAEAEGEGFTDLEDWRTGHREYWARDAQYVTDDTPVMCLYFKLLSRSDSVVGA